MAPKVVVPADFGIENLHSQFHGNVVLKLQGGEDMKANSLILSYHSSVFVHLFLELQQSVLEMEDFVGEAVKSFLGALYSGEIQLVRHLFRDVNKLCHVFKVEWLSGRCWDYFTGLVGGVSVHTDYHTLLFLFEEARFCMRVMKCDKFVDLVVQKICGLENRAEIFVEPYMKNYSELETSQLDLMIQITESNPASLLKIMKRNFIENGYVLDKHSRYLLNKVDLNRSVSEDYQVFEALFDIVLDRISNISLAEHRNITKMYRNAAKQSTSKCFGTVCSTNDPLFSRNVPKPKGLSLSINKISNLFCSFDNYADMNLMQYITIAGESFTSMSQFMEGFLYLCFNKDVKDLTDPFVIHKIADIRSSRSWNKISPDFLKNWKLTGTKKITSLLLASDHIVDKVCNTVNIILTGEVVSCSKIYDLMPLTARTLFFSEKCFIFDLPKKSFNCSFHGSCSFMLKITPIKCTENSRKLNIRYCLNQAEYPPGHHAHPGEIKAGDIHLMLMGSFQDLGKKDNFALLGGALSWNDKGLQIIENDNSDEGNHKIQLGLWKFWIDSPIKLVAFMK